jgi:D-3-phosphoglycerate dehydrogenase / 2-oxoglutarate reductase
LGLGKIGTRIAKFCQAFDMKVLACDPYLTVEQVATRGAIKVALPELLEKSDFISVHCPRTKETTGMFGTEAFAAMKPTAYFINTARALIHREDALLAALHAEKIAGAEATYNMSVAAAEQWNALLRGKVPPRLVNPEVWPRYSDRFEQILGFRPDPLP